MLPDNLKILSGAGVSLPANNSDSNLAASSIAGSVMPIKRAEELLVTLPGVISARIIAAMSGAVEEIHILTSSDVTPKQTVRNVESALIAHLGMHVSHKKISVATSGEPHRAPRLTAPEAPAAQPTGPQIVVSSPAESLPDVVTRRRRIYFEDVEVRRSRTKGVACRVTLRKGDETFIGESEGMENERLRVELAARATIAAIAQVVGENPAFSLEGCKVVDAFDREFVFVGITTRHGRDTTLMTGSAEVRESPETSSVLAVLDATNRWLSR